MATVEQIRAHEAVGTKAAVVARGKAWRIAGYATMVLAIALIGLPLLWMISAAFKETREIYVVPATWIPRDPTVSNFPRAWQAAPFGLYYLNTTIVTVIGVVGKLTLGSLTAYALVMLSFPFKNVIFALILGAIMVPPQVQIIPNYLFFADLNLVNTLTALSVPHVPTAIGTFLLRQAFLSVPREVLDAARVDGAGHARLLWMIMLPLSLPVVVTFTLLSTQDVWNEFLWPIVITNTANMRTLPVGIFSLLDQEGNTQWGVVMAGAIYVIAPLIAVFLWAQRHIVEGIAAGAVKG